MQVVDLKENAGFIRQYVDLRNRYVDLLLTREVLREETGEWLEKPEVEVRCLVEGDVLAGAVILYLGRGGEVAFFVREPGKGVGSELLRIIEGVGMERGLRSLWAWVLRTNIPALKTFLKNHYIIDGETEKWHKGSAYRGYLLKKRISPGRTDREETNDG